MDDADLVRQVLDGNSEAYAELAGRYAGYVHALCRARVWRVEDAEELAQETLYRGLRDLSTLHDPRRFGPWLAGIARNVCRNWLKDRQNAQVPFTDCESNGHAGRGPVLDRPQEEPETPLDVDELMNAVHSLPEECREVILLYYSNDFTYRELAA